MMAVANLRSEYVCFSFAQSLMPGNTALRYDAADVQRRRSNLHRQAIKGWRKCARRNNAI
jgi:hypothetical protein